MRIPKFSLFSGTAGPKLTASIARILDLIDRDRLRFVVEDFDGRMFRFAAGAGGVAMSAAYHPPRRGVSKGGAGARVQNLRGAARSMRRSTARNRASQCPPPSVSEHARRSRIDRHHLAGSSVGDCGNEDAEPAAADLRERYSSRSARPRRSSAWPAGSPGATPHQDENVLRSRLSRLMTENSRMRRRSGDDEGVAVPPLDEVARAGQPFLVAARIRRREPEDGLPAERPHPGFDGRVGHGILEICRGREQVRVRGPHLGQDGGEVLVPPRVLRHEGHLDAFLPRQLDSSLGHGLGEQQVLEDLVQEAALHVLGNLNTFEPRHVGAMQAYLRQSVINRICDEVRRIGRQPPPLELPDDHPCDRMSPEEDAIRAEAYEHYRDAVLRLNAKDRALIVARIEMQWSLAEIAHRYGMPTVDAARMAVNRAVKRLSVDFAARRK